MASDLVRFSLMELSVVKEMANIGLGHATTALSDMTGKPFNMDIPNVDSVMVDTVPNLLGGTDDLTVSVYMPFVGDVDGHIAFLFPWESARALWTTLLGMAPATVEDVDEMSVSAMLEIGNIINSSFLNAIADMTGMRLEATPPLVSVDTSFSILSTIVAEAEMNEAAAIAIETSIRSVDDASMKGFFFCIPTMDGLRTMFQRLGIVEAA